MHCCSVENVIYLAFGYGTENASCGRTTYVHCKAGRGRSTTIVLCYLVMFYPCKGSCLSVNEKLLVSSSDIRFG